MTPVPGAPLTLGHFLWQELSLCPLCVFAEVGLGCLLSCIWSFCPQSVLSSFRAPSRITSRGTSSPGTNCVMWQRQCHEASRTCMRMCPGAVARATSLLLPTGTWVKELSLRLCWVTQRASVGNQRCRPVVCQSKPGLPVCPDS